MIELGSLALLTFLVYASLIVVQRALWDNGRDLSTALIYPRPAADHVAGLGQTFAVVALGLATTALFAWLVIRAPRFAEVGLAWATITIPAVLVVVFFFLPPSLSIDAYSYLSHGYLAATPGDNPYLQTSASVATSPFGQALLGQGWQAVHPQTPYGPVWTLLERLAYQLSGGNVSAGILLVKLPVLLAVIGTGLLVWVFLRRVAPDRQLRGTLLFVANPIIIVELIGEGHNDGVMAFFVVLAIYAASRRMTAIAVVALAVAALVKLNALPFALPLLVALVILRRSTIRLVLGLIVGCFVSVGLAVISIAPYWAGLQTLTGLASSGTASPGLSVAGVLTKVLGGSGASVTLAVLLIIAAAASSLLARSVMGLARACGILSLAILLLLPLEWPWYATLPAAILPLCAELADVAAVIALAAGSRAVAPIGDASALGIANTFTIVTVQALIGQTIPALTGLVLTIRRTVRDTVTRRGTASITDPSSDSSKWARRRG